MTKYFDLKSLLVKRGFLPIQAQIWAEFVTQALALYWQAVELLVEPKRWAEFEGKSGALGKPKRRGKNVGEQFPIEDAITSEIGEIVRDLRARLPGNHILRKYEAHFEFESPVKSSTRAGRHLKKVDHRVICEFPNGPELVIEAKPILTQADVSNRYLVADGIGCFLTDDSPYSRSPLGAMWAYAINSNGQSFKDDILLGLQKFEPKVVSLDKIVGLCTSDSTKEIDCSLHNRTSHNLAPITILHLECNFPRKVPA